MTLAFRILGPLEVDGAPALGGPKPRTLLARLLLEPNRVVAYDELIDALWPEDPPERARHTLQVYVSSLRRALGRDRLRADRSGYAIRVDAGELDLVRFEELSAEGARRLGAGDPEGAHSCLTEALSLWRGAALADVAPALEAERARLEELRLVAGEEEIEAALALGRHTELVPRLEALVRRHPTRERPRRQLMLALYRSGRQADALETYRDARRTLVEELGLEPSRELRALEAAILRHDPALELGRAETRERVRHLPAPATPMVGRRRELEEISALLASGTRLVTLTGPGGSGKTRLALQAADEAAAHFADGAVFVGLGALQDPELVLAEIARALGVEDARDPRTALVEQLRSRAKLLVVDNFEQLVQAAPVVAGLLAEAPGLKLLVTSRQALRVYGEHEYPVEPLALEDEAVPLFLERAAAVGRRLEAGGPVRELCRRLDCLPLAIELAAARTREVSLEDLRTVLPRLEVAVGGLRDVPARQLTLRATIGWSYELLDSGERRLFEELGVFAGGCTPADAETVTGASDSAIKSLADKSLLRRDEERLSMLETIREYALEKLEASGRADDVRRRHAEHFLALAESGERLRRTPAEVEWMNRLDADRDNVRAALAWWLERDPRVAARLVDGAFRFWYIRGHFEEGALACERVLESAELSEPGRAELLYNASGFEYALRRLKRARPLAEEGLDIRRRLGDQDAVARSLVMLGTILVEEDEHGSALPLLEESVALARQVDDPVLLAFTSANLAAGLLSARELDRFQPVGEEALALARLVGDAARERATLVNLGLAALLAGDPVAGAARCAEGLELARELGEPLGVLESIEGIAAAATACGRMVEGSRLLGAAEALKSARGLILEAVCRLVREQALETLRNGLDEQELLDAWSAGAKLGSDEATAEAASVAATVVLSDRSA